MIIFRYFSVLALLLVACRVTSSDGLSSTAEAITDQSVECELMYAAHPHKKAIVAIGENRLKETLSFNFDEMTEFSREFMPMTLEIASLSGDDSVRINEQELVLGGYEGVTIPSVVIRVSVLRKEGYAALLRIASHIGYVYAQDSTLVICATKLVDGWDKVSSLEVVDQGKVNFFTERNVPLFFGLMIGAFNGPERLGYTFYKDSKIFSTFSESGRSLRGNSVIESLSVWLNELSNGDVDLSISSGPVSIFFPHNDWETNPEGESFQHYMEQGRLNPVLVKNRERYIQRLDQFLNRRQKR